MVERGHQLGAAGSPLLLKRQDQLGRRIGGEGVKLNISVADGSSSSSKGTERSPMPLETFGRDPSLGQQLESGAQPTGGDTQVVDPFRVASLTGNALGATETIKVLPE
jgi:hypothetical protein